MLRGDYINNKNTTVRSSSQNTHKLKRINTVWHASTDRNTMDQIVNIMTTTATAAEDSPDRTPVINIGPSIVDPILTRTHVDDVAVPISITTDVEDTDIQASYNNNTDTSGASSMATTTATTAAISTNTGVVISAYRSNSANQIASAKDSHLSKGICLSPNNSSGVTLGKQKRSSNTTENNSGSVKKESLIHRLFKRKTVPIGSIGRSGAGKAATFLSPVYENGNSSSGGTGLHQSPQQQQQQQQQYISPKPSVFAQKPIKRPVITVNVGTNTAPTDTNCNDAIGASSASNAESSASTSGTVTGSGYDGWPSKVSKGPSEDLLTQLSNYEFLLKAQKDNIRTLELALQECKLDSLQVVPLRYTIHTLKSQLESLQAENSALRSDSTSLDFKLLCYKDKVSKLEAQHCGAVDRAVAAETSVAKLTTTNRCTLISEQTP